MVSPVMTMWMTFMLMGPLAQAHPSHHQLTITVTMEMLGYSSVSGFSVLVITMVVTVRHTVWIQTTTVGTTPVGPMGRRGAGLGGPILLETASHVRNLIV